jgi:hypothetical protein
LAAPSFVAASTGGQDISGEWIATCHSPGAANRVIIFQYLQDGTSSSPPTISSTTNILSLAGVSGSWTAAPNNPYAIGSPTAANQYVFFGRSTSTSAPEVTGANVGGNDVYFRFYEFQNVSTGTTLATVIENGSAGSTANGVGTSNTAADTGVTTLDTDRLAINLLGINDDNPFAGFSGETGGTWTTEASFASATGNDAAIYLIDAPMASAGTINGGTGSITDSDAWGVVGFALIGTTAAAAYQPRHGFVSYQDPGVL